MGHQGDGFNSKWRFTEGGVYHGYHRVCDTPPALWDETNPRRALAMALGAALRGEGGD